VGVVYHAYVADVIYMCRVGGGDSQFFQLRQYKWGERVRNGNSISTKVSYQAGDGERRRASNVKNSSTIGFKCQLYSLDDVFFVNYLYHWVITYQVWYWVHSEIFGKGA